MVGNAFPSFTGSFGNFLTPLFPVPRDPLSVLARCPQGSLEPCLLQPLFSLSLPSPHSLSHQKSQHFLFFFPMIACVAFYSFTGNACAEKSMNISCKCRPSTISHVFLREGLAAEAVVCAASHTRSHYPRQEQRLASTFFLQLPQEHMVSAFPWLAQVALLLRAVQR